MNLLHRFVEVAARGPDRIAIVDRDGRTITYGDLMQRSSRVAAAWRRRGIVQGDRVLVAMPIGIELYVTIAALWRLGAAIVLPEPAMGLAGLTHAVRATQPAALAATGLFRWLRFLPALWRVRQVLSPFEEAPGDGRIAAVAAEDAALLSFTSGSTGAPKTMARSHALLSAQNRCVEDVLAAAPGGDVDLVAFPAFVIANLGMGTTSVLPAWNVRRHHLASSGQIVRQMKAHGVTRLLIPPSICEVLARGGELPALRTIFTGGGPVFADLLERLKQNAPHTQIVSVYGSTEAEPIAHLPVTAIGDADWQAMRSGSGLLAGAPVPAIEVDLVEGEIVVTGDHVSTSYLGGIGDEENKLRIGDRIWHRTGDAGRFDAAGRLWLRGRLSAKAGPYFPFEVESAARFWPGVTRCALVPGKTAILAVCGDAAQAPAWRAKAQSFPGLSLRIVPDIPLDARHRSKVDYRKLARMVT